MPNSRIPSADNLVATVGLNTRDIASVSETLKDFMRTYRTDREHDAQDTAASRAKMDAKLDAITDRLGQQGKPNYLTFFAAISAIALFVKVGYDHVDLNNAVKQAPIIAEQGISKAERVQNHEYINRLAQTMSDNNAKLTSNLADIARELSVTTNTLGAEFRETETQVDAMSQMANIKTDYDARLVSVITGKGDPGPRFFPNMSRRKDHLK